MTHPVYRELTRVEMGRALMNQAPLDNYRKQIGQQANRIDKRHHKEKVKVQGARVCHGGGLCVHWAKSDRGQFAGGGGINGGLR